MASRWRRCLTRRMPARFPARYRLDRPKFLVGSRPRTRMGSVHRDLKRDNIFILNTEDRPHFVKSSDLLASRRCLVPQVPRTGAAGRESGTVVGTVLGTAALHVPEQGVLGQVTLNHIAQQPLVQNHPKVE